jgi:glycosyltransferase involved in cell wall biosynthesis
VTPVPARLAAAPFADEGARISCLMVTADRRALAERSVDCFLAQTYPNRELIVVDDGAQDYAPLLSRVPADRLIHHRIAKDPATTLGALRNLSLDLARGELIAQWDDDDWFDPERLARQVVVLGDRAACWCPVALMHLADPAWLTRPYIGWFQGGVPSTILHRRRDDIRYPLERKGEDSTYRDAWRRHGHVLLDEDEAALLIRCFHGANTWDRDHFEKRIALAPCDVIEWQIRRVFGRTDGYSRFRLTPRQRASFDAFFAHSRALGLF